MRLQLDAEAALRRPVKFHGQSGMSNATIATKGRSLAWSIELRSALPRAGRRSLARYSGQGVRLLGLCGSAPWRLFPPCGGGLRRGVAPTWIVKASRAQMRPLGQRAPPTPTLPHKRGSPAAAAST